VEGIPTVPGAVHRYRLDCGRGAGKTLAVSGGFAPTKFLSLASPSGASTRVSRAQATFPVVVFYDEAILPESFRATLNGVDVSGRFRPKPANHEVVRLQLKPGHNEVVLSVQGRRPTGEPLSLPTRLEFQVQ